MSSGITSHPLPGRRLRANARRGQTDADGFVESFNGRLRDECLNEHLFRSFWHAREIIEDWKIDYNLHRPHTSLDGLTPNEF